MDEAFDYAAYAVENLLWINYSSSSLLIPNKLKFFNVYSTLFFIISAVLPSANLTAKHRLMS